MRKKLFKKKREHIASLLLFVGLPFEQDLFFMGREILIGTHKTKICKALKLYREEK